MKVNTEHSSLHIRKTNKHYCFKYPSAKGANKSINRTNNKNKRKNEKKRQNNKKKTSRRINSFYKMYNILDSPKC